MGGPSTDTATQGAILSQEPAAYDNLAFEDYCGRLKKEFPPNRKVLLIQIPQTILASFNPEVARKRGYYAFPPTGLQCLYEEIKTRDLNVEILDVNLLLLKRVHEDSTFESSNWVSLLAEHLEKQKIDPQIIGVSCMFDAGIKPLIQVLEYLIKRGKSIVITGGVIATYEWKNLLKRDLCHLVFHGESENKLNYLLDRVTDEDAKHAPTPGISFKDSTGYHETQGDADVVTVKTDLISSYDHIRIEEYYKYGSLNPFSRMAVVRDSRYAAIQMNRGCRAACTFCAVRDFNGKGVRNRSAELVVREMEFLIKERGIRHFEWLDDDLLFYKDELHEVLQAVVDNKWDITWSANNGLIAAAVDDKTLKLIRDSGCIGFKIGVETGNPEMLKLVRKPATINGFRQFSSKMQAYPEIFVGGNFIVGFPKETFSQMMDSLRFYLTLDLDWAAFTVCQIIRGASGFSEFEDYFDKQMDSDGALIKNFIPARNAAEDPSQQEKAAKLPVLQGLDVFDIPYGFVPGEEQIKEIWFTFNMVGNFINNKNLRPHGHVEKFISWVEMALYAYPKNPYMSLFLALAYQIDGDKAKSDEFYKIADENHHTDYWLERFKAFGLLNVLRDFPKDRDGAFKTLEGLRQLANGRFASHPPAAYTDLIEQSIKSTNQP